MPGWPGPDLVLRYIPGTWLINSARYIFVELMESGGSEKLTDLDPGHTVGNSWGVNWVFWLFLLIPLCVLFVLYHCLLSIVSILLLKSQAVRAGG